MISINVQCNDQTLGMSSGRILSNTPVCQLRTVAFAWHCVAAISAYPALFERSDFTVGSESSLFQCRLEREVDYLT